MLTISRIAITYLYAIEILMMGTKRPLPILLLVIGFYISKYCICEVNNIYPAQPDFFKIDIRYSFKSFMSFCATSRTCFNSTLQYS